MKKKKAAAEIYCIYNSGIFIFPSLMRAIWEHLTAFKTWSKKMVTCWQSLLLLMPSDLFIPPHPTSAPESCLSRQPVAFTCSRKPSCWGPPPSWLELNCWLFCRSVEMSLPFYSMLVSIVSNQYFFKPQCLPKSLVKMTLLVFLIAASSTFPCWIWGYTTWETNRHKTSRPIQLENITRPTDSALPFHLTTRRLD